MPNNYFQFKQFKVEQDECAMKVCTDSCLFGAWITLPENTNTILDIGTGTGLLSLMLAQESTAKIDAIEIDDNAFLQATINFNNSIWKDRLTCFSGDIKTYPFAKKYDFIVCNPPFYKDEFSSRSHGEKIAKHSLLLSLNELLISIENQLNDEGKFAILLPFYRKDEFENLAKQCSFFPENILLIKQTPTHQFFRYAAIFSKNPEVLKEDVIDIKNNSNEYSSEAIKLLKPFYLYL